MATRSGQYLPAIVFVEAIAEAVLAPEVPTWVSFQIVGRMITGQNALRLPLGFLGQFATVPRLFLEISLEFISF